MYLNESILKIMKNAFYFMLKAIFVLKIFKYFSFVDHKKNSLVRKLRLIHLRVFNKQLQCTYCPVSQEVKSTRQ